MVCGGHSGANSVIIYSAPCQYKTCDFFVYKKKDILRNVLVFFLHTIEINGHKKYLVINKYFLVEKKENETVENDMRVSE